MEEILIHLRISQIFRSIINKRFEKLITNTFDLENINMAIDNMRSGETSGRIIINL